VARVVRVQLRHTLDQDPTGINGLRAMVLIGQDEESLAVWSRNVMQSGESEWDSSFRLRTVKPVPDVLYAPALGSDRDSWVFLIKRVSLLLLASVSEHPRCVDKVHPIHFRVTQYA
jgi:ubiquitin-protein ligase E3 C